MRFPWALAASLSLGCGADPFIGEQSLPISSGFEASTLSSVPLLATSYRGGLTSYCSGVLVAPRLVLTAAHCVRFPERPDSFSAYFGADSTDPNDPEWLTTLDVSSWEAHPLYDPSDTAAGHDLALLTLVDDAPVEALPLLSTEPQIGTETLIVGWGMTDPSLHDGGIRRFAVADLSDVTPLHAHYGGHTGSACRGDSGGPLLMEREGELQVAGIASFGASSCVANAVASRVDVALASFIAPKLGDEAPSANEDGAQVSAGCTVGTETPRRGFLLVLAALMYAGVRRRKRARGPQKGRPRGPWSRCLWR